MYSLLISIIFLILFGILAVYWKRIGLILFVGFITRFGAAFINLNLFTLPAGAADAATFESRAWLWSQQSQNILASDLLRFGDSYLISWVGSVIYNLFGREPMLLSMLNVVLGTITILVVYKTARLLISKKNSLIVTWIYTLHPTVIEHSAVFLRESIIIFFLSLSVFFFVKWILQKKVQYLLFTFLLLFFSSMFHGAMFIGVLGIGLTILFYMLYNSFSVLKQYLIKKHVVTLYSFSIIALIIIFTLPLPRIGKIGNLLSSVTSGSADIERIAMVAGRTAEVRATGTTAYLENMTLQQPTDLFWQTPVRVVYFLYSPFPWDISAVRHLKGFIDSGFLFFMTFIMLKHRKKLWEIRVYRYLFIFLIIYIAAFSFGTSNVGSAIRHKAKFLPIILLFYGLKDQIRYLPFIRSKPLSS